MSDTRWEDRARGVKAYKLAAVMEKVMAVDESITLADVEAADETFRARIAKVAQTNMPSERTWSVMVGLLQERANAPADPFVGLS